MDTFCRHSKPKGKAQRIDELLKERKHRDLGQTVFSRNLPFLKLTVTLQGFSKTVQILYI